MDEMEARVWQRVSGRAGTERPDLLRLSREAAACLRLLSGAAGMNQGRVAALFRREEAISRTLCGMAHLRGEGQQNLPSGWREENCKRGLSLAYRRSRKLWEGLSACTGDGEFGQVYAWLTAQEQQIGAEILEILGKC